MIQILYQVNSDMMIVKKILDLMTPVNKADPKYDVSIQEKISDL